MSPRRNKDNRPDNLWVEKNPDGSVKRYIYNNPVTGKRTSFGTDKHVAYTAARRANDRLYGETDLVAKAVGSARVTIHRAMPLFKGYLRDGRDLATKTLLEYERMLGTIDTALGARVLADLEVEPIAAFLDRLPPASSNRHRSLLIQLFAYAMSKGWMKWNAAEATMVRKEKVQRRRLTLEGFRAIHQAAPQNIRDAMDLSLQTLQARLEVSRMGRADLSRDPDGTRRLRVVRQKTAKRTTTAWLSIEVGAELGAIIDRCTTLASPYFVRGERYRAGRMKPVKPESITRGFAKARDSAGLYDDVPAAERPTFHEVRSLGANLMRKAGRPEPEIQALLGHADAAMTEHYLSGHEPELVRVRGAGIKM